MAVEYVRANELKAFDDTKAGVKGLVDAGVVKVPRIFIRPQDELHKYPVLNSDLSQFKLPLIDLQDVDADENRRKKVVEQVRHASETWGFFQIENHGIPISRLSDIIESMYKFHEQDVEVKKKFYTRDLAHKVRFNSSWDLFTSHAACWRDTFSCSVAPTQPQPHELPEVCRDAIIEYTKCAMKLGETLFELISEALGLKPNHLKEMECTKACRFGCHYYPPCPEPNLTLGTGSHTDPAFLSVLLQDNVGGLQFLHQNKWVDVLPIPGALVVNIGDLLQLISNDKIKSVEHRVLSNNVKSRISASVFFSSRNDESKKYYGPMKELLSDENPAKYRETLVTGLVKHAAAGVSALEHLRL